MNKVQKGGDGSFPMTFKGTEGHCCCLTHSPVSVVQCFHKGRDRARRFGSAAGKFLGSIKPDLWIAVLESIDEISC